MARVEDYRSWWPWLRHFDGGGLAAGSTWVAVVQPPLPYRLRFELHLVSELTPTNAVLRAVSQFAAPVARFGHEWVLDTGLRQFRASAFP